MGVNSTYYIHTYFKCLIMINYILLGFLNENLTDRENQRYLTYDLLYFELWASEYECGW